MLKIDNIDMSPFGIDLLKGTLTSFVQLAALKKPDSVQWYSDGFDVDLSEPVLEARKVKINLILKTLESYNKLNYIIRSAHSHTWDIGIGRTFTLRTIKLSSYKEYGDKFRSVTVELSQDNPNENIDADAVAVGCGDDNDSVTMDEVALSDYGVSLLRGAREALNAPISIAAPLVTKSNYVAGVENHGVLVKTTAKDITIPMCLKATSNVDFWANYDAFVTALLQPDVRELYVQSVGEFEFYYLSMNVTKFFVKTNQLVMAFNLKVKVI